MLDSLRAALGRPAVRAIGRRYFVSNGFDGTLTCIGIVLGSVLTGVAGSPEIVKIGVGAAVGLGTSAVWSVWEIERAETAAEIHELEAAMLVDLDDTSIQRRQQGGRLFHAVASGAGPLVGIFLPLSPFVLAGAFLDLWTMAAVSVALAVGLLGVFGAYMGTVAGQRWYVSAGRMALAGVVVAAINLLVG